MSPLMNRILPRLLPLSSALLLSTAAHAFSFTPLSISFDPIGNGSSRSFQVHNDSDAPIAVELSMASRELDVLGKETSEKTPEVENRFLVFPPQIVLKAGEKRSIRISWIGPQKLERELAYRVIAEQLPVTTEKPTQKKTGAMINILLRYVGAVYITPESATPRISVKEAIPNGDKLSLLFENSGTAHQVLNGLRLKISSAADPSAPPVTLGPADLKDVEGQNLLPGNSRRFLIPWPSDLPKGPVKVDFEIKG